MLKTPLNLAMLGDPEAQQYCEMLGLGTTFATLTDPGCSTGVTTLVHDSLEDLAIDASGTFTRASTSYFQQPDGLWVPTLTQEARWKNARRVQNLAPHSHLFGRSDGWRLNQAGTTYDNDTHEVIVVSRFGSLRSDTSFTWKTGFSYSCVIDCQWVSGNLSGIRLFTNGGAQSFMAPAIMGDGIRRVLGATVLSVYSGGTTDIVMDENVSAGTVWNIFGICIVESADKEFITRGEATGSELVVNGDFDSDTGFVKGAGWTISGGAAVGTASTANLEQQTWTPKAGHTYRIEYDLAVTGGTVRPSIGGTASAITDSTAGHKIHIITATNATGYLYIDAVTAFTGTIDNLTCKECAHNAGVNGVQYFDYENGNSVDANGVVTEATGAALPGPFGLLMEPARTNYLLNSEVPVTQTTGSLATGTYCLWVEGTGSAAVTAGTATITGNGTASAGTPNTFTVTGAGTVTVTITGTLTKFQLENGSEPSSFILTAGSPVVRAVDALEYDDIDPDNETRLIIDATNVDIDDWDGNVPVPTAPYVLSDVAVYAPGERPA